MSAMESSLGVALMVSSLVPILKMNLNYQRTKMRLNSLLQRLYSAGNTGPRYSSADPTRPLYTNERRDFFRHLLNECFEEIGLSPRIIHVAGTKGKGSTCEYIASCLRCSGYRVGIFTSPHIHTARERIKIGKELIGVDDLIRLSEAALRQMEHLPWVCFFDLFLFIAIKHFGEKGVDYIVLETGIGGRYDSTNFIEKPLVSVITNIGLDHQNMLGNTLEEIAWHKAGIIKKNCEVFVTGNQHQSILDVFAKEALLMNSNIHFVGTDNNDAKMVPLDVNYNVQSENLSLAVAVLRFIGISNFSGLNTFYWPCRMEKFLIPISARKYVTFIVDGNHNGDSVRLFLKDIRRLYIDHKVVVLFGSGIDKNVGTMVIESLLGADFVIPVQSQHFKSADVSKLNVLFEKQIFCERIQSHATSPGRVISPPSHLEGKGNISSTIDWVINSIRSKDEIICKSSENCIVVTCGSLFVASDTREHLFKLAPEAFDVNDWVREKF